MRSASIKVIHARQNNLKDLTLELPLNALVVVTGVSGSGKSSLAFDTIYAEGQRRYVETFSPYARQFLDRMDKPQVERVEGIPPAIAIDQVNPVRTSRSTVGTMTELNDHLKLLFARTAQLFCAGCGDPVRRDNARSISDELMARTRQAESLRAIVTFPVAIPHNFTREEVMGNLAGQGYTRLFGENEGELEVVQDRLRLHPERRDRLYEDLETALLHGNGRLRVHLLDDTGRELETLAYSAELHCPRCDIHYSDPTPSLFSFNSPVGACTTCRGFGRTMGIDYGLVVPDENLSLAEGAVRPWQSESYRECQDDLMRFARRRGIPTTKPWRELSEAQREWVIEGEGSWDEGKWYGARRFFEWLETKSYRMHIRVLLSRYRSYNRCPDCLGARLKPEALDWRLGSRAEADAVLPGERFHARHYRFSSQRLRNLPGLTLHDLATLPIDACHRFFDRLRLPGALDEATELLLGEIRSRLGYLVEVGLGYLTLDRQSRTLSGGEVQRINLTTALGTSLVNTLFVLDEPSIGLHPRDMNRVIGILHRLRDAGNSLLVVEHDPEIMRAADRVVDMGPGPGERGGEVVFEGTPAQLIRSNRSLTGQYLSGKRPGYRREKLMQSGPVHHQLELKGVSANNLKDIDVAIPLGGLVCVTGVSGSGKSTLVEEVLYRALCKKLGKPVESPGAHRALSGDEHLADVVLVDQSPIGKTTRSNPASFVGALDAIRKRFAQTPLALERGYTAGTFSFNSGNGRCPTCSGNGFEHVEMQFLSDVYLRCPDCSGRRYRDEVLEVRFGDRSIADVLELTVSDAVRFFADFPDVLRGLEPLESVGLGYLRLGQPVPTLSGGEAQRLKLAGHLAKQKPTQGKTLFLFDEPTTGLHFADIEHLLRAFDRLIEAGHSVVVIEHNLEVIAAADWLIDLGPEGGAAGGRVVATGTPEAVSRHRKGHTARALRDHFARQSRRQDVAPGKPPARPPRRARARRQPIAIHHAREHNLRNIDVTIPPDRFTVITGVSGSGKSTIAFDILFAEGQRRYLESLNAYARQFVQPASRPDVDAIYGIPPTVAIEQRTSRGGRKSTVATMTEIYHFLRLLFVKLGVQYCPDCDIPIEPQSPEAIAAQLIRRYRDQTIRLHAPLITARKGYYTDLARWAAKQGYPILRVDGEDLPTDPWPRLDRYREHDIDLPVGSLRLTRKSEAELMSLLETALDFGKGTVKVEVPRKRQPLLFSTRRACPGCARSFPELDPRLFSYNSKLGWCPHCFGTGDEIAGFDAEQSGEERIWNEWRQDEGVTCPHCEGRRLRPEALAVRFHGESIADYTALSVRNALKRLETLKLDRHETLIARDLLQETKSRLRFLQEVGLGYLTLDRAAPTLSGGEAQRIRLAAQLGSNLQGVCYILDEPTIGLHPRDNRMLLETLKRLQAKGNSVVVVEHDEETIRSAEHLIDLGPGAGVHGGEVVAEGTLRQLMRSKRSLTGRLLAHPIQHPLVTSRPWLKEAPPPLIIRGARMHNLKGLDIRIPLGRVVCVTGVSGSGKSTLVRRVLGGNLSQLLAGRRRRKSGVILQGCDAIEGWESVQRLLEVDQTPIGKTPRSCPATYVGIWDAIRKLFAQTGEARLRGYGPGRFSFNVKGGRCELCEGQGIQKIEMSFLPDVKVLCDGCGGSRFDGETRAILYKGRSVADVLAMSIDEATDFFSAHPAIHHTLRLLQEVGLGYLTLGQQSPTLSGGEAQRIKLVTELAKARSRLDRQRGGKNPPHTLYILDEPTIGLHMADVEKLLRVLHRLVAAGNSVVVIEHNIDVIAEADWLIDMGPEGGSGGGRIVAQGAPEKVARRQRGSHTARYLRELLRERSR
ncbi:MAG: excinuclease ABC subunit UvrA [Gammaproteobacteria bacterium]